METVTVAVQRDYLQRMIGSKSPVSAVIELVWNGLDADARNVSVVFCRNELRGITEIRVVDDGHGIHRNDGKRHFGELGGSWKGDGRMTQSRRALHGRHGKGRFQAYALGALVTWSTVHRDDSRLVSYTIKGHSGDLTRFQFSDSQQVSNRPTGTTVTITNVLEGAEGLDSSRVRRQIEETFALYLRQYPDVSIILDGEAIRSDAVIARVTDVPIELDPGDFEPGLTATLTIVEWTISTERAIHLCDENGLTLRQTPAGVHAKGFSFTAYLRSAVLNEMAVSGEINFDPLTSRLSKLVESAKSTIRAHFRARSAEQSGDLVDQWKRDDVYPYLGAPQNILEEAERQVFDVLALNVHEYLPEFATSGPDLQRFSFRLLRRALITSPEAVQGILRDVLALPEQKQRELAELLQKTSLEAVINASRVVADRLDFLSGLEVLVFSDAGKEHVLERRHLHRVVAEHPWIFGEEYSLTASDKSLTNVLRKHTEGLDMELLDDRQVVTETKSTGIVDLMLSRVRQFGARSDEREHLVVELKRPSVSIGAKEAGQIKEYATAIAGDERFRDTNTRWEFWVVATSMSESVRLDANQKDRPSGLLSSPEGLRTRVWVKTWAQIIEECRARLHFFQQTLNYNATEDAGLEYIRKLHRAYLPDALCRGEASEAPKSATAAGGEVA